jgi:hypothetical protein
LPAASITTSAISSSSPPPLTPSTLSATCSSPAPAGPARRLERPAGLATGARPGMVSATGA